MSLTISIPVLGRISAGMPLLAEEQVETTILFDPKLLPRGAGGHRIFGLKVVGDSMRDEGILDGDVVIARQAEVASIGDIVVALVDDGATVKSLYFRDGLIELRPANPAYEPQIYEADQVFIQGVVIGLQRTY